MENRVILLDRDGVINRDRRDYVRHPDEVELIPGSGAALRRLATAGYRILVVTNQAGIAKKLVSEEALASVHARLRELVEAQGGRIDTFYVCPHLPEDGCDCRKPEPGLILRAQKEWAFSPKETYLVGDAWRDIQAAKAAGCHPVLVRSGVHGEKEKPDPQVPDFPDLKAFVDVLLGQTT